MPRVRFGGVVLLFAVHFAGPLVAQAQSIEFDPPDSITPQANAFVVVFKDGVTESAATQIVEAVRPVKYSVSFRPLDVMIQTGKRLDKQVLDSLSRTPEIVSVYRRSARALSDGSASTDSAFTYSIFLQPELSVREARTIVARFPVLSPQAVQKSPNEIEVTLEHENHEIVGSLEDLPEVKYVAYLAVD